MLAGLAIGVCLGCLSISRPAAAQEGVRGERYRMRLQIEENYTAERDGAFVISMQGLVSVGASLVLFSHGDPMSRGAAWPLAIGGGLGAAFGLAQMAYLNNNLVTLRKDLAENPTMFRTAQIERASKEGTFYALFELLEVTAALTGAGILTYGEVKKVPQATGVGAGLLVEGIALLGVTYMTQKRTERYVRALRDFQPDVAVSRDAVAFSVRGIF